MAKIRFYFDTRRALSDRTSYPIKISVFINGKGRFMVDSGLAVSKDNWGDQQIISHPQKQLYNNLLRFKKNKIDDEIISLELSGEIASLSLADIKGRVLAVLNYSSEESNGRKSSILLKDRMEEYIRTSKADMTKSTYQQTLDKIGRYYDLEKLKLQDIDLKWLRTFELKMAEEGLKVNTIGLHFRNLKAVFNRAIDDEVIEQNDYPFRKFKIKSEKTQKRALSVEQLRVLRDFPCQKHHEKCRDLFMLIFYLMGINIVDLVHLKKIVNGRIEYRRFKTGTLYSIKVEPEAMAIIERYKGKEYLIDILDNYSDYKHFMHLMNRELKKIGPYEMVENNAKNKLFVKKNKKKVTPLFPELSTYWARHTSATIAASLDIPKETIAAMLGHSENSVTDVYIKFDNRKIDKANRQVIDYVNSDLVHE